MLGGPFLESWLESAAGSPDQVYVSWRSAAWADTTRIFLRRGETVTDVPPVPAEAPSAFTVSPFYPNPFNPLTHARFFVPRREEVAITVHDLLGRTVSTLFEGIREQGWYEADVDGSILAGGVYFVRFRFATRSVTRPVVLLR